MLLTSVYGCNIKVSLKSSIILSNWLGFYALNLVFLFWSGSSQKEQSIAYQLLSLPFGRILTAALGLGFVAFGVYGLAEARYERPQSAV